MAATDWDLDLADVSRNGLDWDYWNAWLRTYCLLTLIESGHESYKHMSPSEVKVEHYGEYLRRKHSPETAHRIEAASDPERVAANDRLVDEFNARQEKSSVLFKKDFWKRAAQAVYRKDSQ